MSEQLLSIGLDVGTTSTQLILSRLTVENKAGAFAVPELDIADREILYRSPIHFTPLLDESHVDGAALRALVEGEYRSAGITRDRVDTGAVIITGETSRKENARTVLDALSDFAGDFVVATAGPDLESLLAAQGAGAMAYSEKTGKTVLHMDIGGGTSNLALIRDGKTAATTCLNVGGRLVKYDGQGIITYVSPVLQGIASLKVGDSVTEELLQELSETLVKALEMAAGRRPETELLQRLTTEEVTSDWQIPENAVLSFSGGVADCIPEDLPWQSFGDLGPVLGRTIRKSALCRGDYVLGSETIRATVIGAGCHSVCLSGSTVFHRNISFPLKNLPVAEISQWDRHAIRREAKQQDTAAVLALPGLRSPSYSRIVELAEELLAAGEGPYYVCLEQDMAKALGQALAVRTGPEVPILCIDRVRVRNGTYLDIGTPIGPALPVVVKTLILGR